MNMFIRSTIFVFMFCLSIPCQAIKWISQIVSPFTYLGDTPYQNLSFNSPSITTALRVQRDIAMNITIDQLIWPAIDLSTAYFSKDYSTQHASQVDNLLIMGYKRLVVDIYWDPLLLDWQLCPFALNHSTDATADIKLANGYTCSTKFKFRNLMETINNYLVSTDTTTAPTKTDIVTLILNLHELNTTSSLTRPVTDSNLGQIVHESVSASLINTPRIYTPMNLTLDRVNVSASFYAHGREPYFPQVQQQQMTEWPHWLYLIQEKVQLMVGFGTIQTGADVTFRLSLFDNRTIFDTQSLGGQMKTDDTSCAQTHHWDFVGDQQARFSYQSALNVTQCGLSPYFTHANYSNQATKYSDIDNGHLADNVLSTIWSWDVNQPTNDEVLRCAAMLTKNGRWQANDCADEYRVACRSALDPNVWLITKNAHTYDRSLSACPNNFIFDVPRVPHQNNMLKIEIEAENVTEEKIWINLNLVDNDNACWVIDRYGTCWWANHNSTEYLGLITTSIVAGVIILILVGIFAWVKCARSWRNRNSKSRKAMVKAMLKRREYVTVPA